MTTKKASGEFDIKMVPQSDELTISGLGRLTLDKTYRGDIVGTGKGQMLGFRTQTEGSAGYVAMEMVEGTLDGKSGSFMLQHNALMDRGSQSQTIVVVPDSGTGELAGLTGTLKIIIKDKKHYYEMEYSL